MIALCLVAAVSFDGRHDHRRLPAQPFNALYLICTSTGQGDVSSSHLPYRSLAAEPPVFWAVMCALRDRALGDHTYLQTFFGGKSLLKRL
jgi:hypothetical protein